MIAIFAMRKVAREGMMDGLGRQLSGQLYMFPNAKSGSEFGGSSTTQPAKAPAGAG